MTKKRKTDADIEQAKKNGADELFSSLPGSGEFAFSELSPAVLGSIIWGCSYLGGLVSCFPSDDRSSFSISIRIGTAKRSYQYPDAKTANRELSRVKDAVMTLVSRKLSEPDAPPVKPVTSDTGDNDSGSGDNLP